MNRDHALRIEDLDAHIQAALKNDPPIGLEHEVIRYAPPAARAVLPPLPSYVEHREGLDVVGKAAAQAMVMQYDDAMKALEAMGKELIAVSTQALAMAEGCVAAVKYITETCDQYRQESKAIFARIEHASALTAEVRRVCDEMRGKIQNAQSEREHPRHSNSGQDEAAADLATGLPHAMVRG